LIICRKIVEAYEGNIFIEEQDPNSKGTTFTFTIKANTSERDQINQD